MLWRMCVWCSQLTELWLCRQQELGHRHTVLTVSCLPFLQTFLIPRRGGVGKKSRACWWDVRRWGSAFPSYFLIVFVDWILTSHISEWPYLFLFICIPSCSKCGALPPESCFFSLICNTGSFMGKTLPTHTHTTFIDIIRLLLLFKNALQTSDMWLVSQPTN